MYGKLLPPPAYATPEFGRDCWVSIEFAGRFGYEFDRGLPTVALPPGTRGFNITNYVGVGGHTIEVQVSFSMSPKLERSAAVKHAVERLDSMECFYPGILDDASNVEISYRVEREQVARFFDPFPVD